MTDWERFRENSRSRGVLVDTNLLVLLMVGSVNRRRIEQFKRTRTYTAADYDLLIAVLNDFPKKYVVPHLLGEVSNLIDLGGAELLMAKAVLKNAIGNVEEIRLPSIDACDVDVYPRLGLTDAAICLLVEECGCSFLTDDLDLYVALAKKGAAVANFNYLRQVLLS